MAYPGENQQYERINWENYPSINTPIDEINLNKIDARVKLMDDTLTLWDGSSESAKVSKETHNADKATLQSEILQTVKTVTYDTSTGVFVFTWWNDTTLEVDLNIEKIPLNFSMSPSGVITMETEDHTTYTADVSSLIKLYTFNDSTDIDFTTTTDASGNKNITAIIKNGSVTAEKLQPNYLADVTQQATNASASATAASGSASSASNSATDAQSSAEDSEAWANGTRNGVDVPSTDPAYEHNARWYAEHANTFAGLTDVNIDTQTLADGDIPVYDETAQKWKNGRSSGGMATDGSNAASHVIFSGAFTVGTRASGSTVGARSTAFGGSNTASEANSHAEGYNTKASGNSSHAEGSNTTASGFYSHAEGQYTIAGHTNQHACGKYNSNKSTTLMEVGNGTSTSARSNAFEVYSDGSLSTDNGTTKTKLPVIKSKPLVAGATLVTFDNMPSSGNNLIQFYTDKPGLDYTAITTSGTNTTLTYPAQSSSTTVYCSIVEVM